MRILLLIIALSLVACDRTPDEEKIRITLGKIEAAVQKRESKSALQYLSRNFSGPEGMDVQQIRQIMAAHFLRNQKIQVVIAGLKIKVEGNDADVRFNAATTGGAGLLPERMQYYAIATVWQKIDGDWLITRADWTPVIGAAN